MSLPRITFSSAIPFLLLGIFITLFFWQSSLVSTLLFVSLVAAYSTIIGLTLYTHIEDTYQTFFGFLTLFATWIILGTGIYYLYGITKPVSMILLVLPAITLSFTKKSHPSLLQFFAHIHLPGSFRSFFFPFLSLIGNAALLAILFTQQTTDTLISPWHAVTPWFFLLYAMAAGCTIVASFREQTTLLRTTLITLFLFTTYAVAAIIYPIGYGFDAFVHRATEMWIYANGFILPKQPYYIGQYSFVTFLAHTTTLPIKWLDIFLVPVLAAYTLPITIEFALKKIFDIEKKFGSILTLFLPFLFYFSFNLTTPHNLVLLFSIIAIFLVAATLREKISWLPPGLLCLAALATHPLLGAPLCLFIFASFLTTKITWQKKYTLISLALFISTSVLLPALFLFQQFLGGHALPSFVNPLTKIPDFLALIARPYWYSDRAPVVFELLYAWQWLITPTCILLAIVGLIKNKTEKKMNALFIAMTLGLIVDAWILRSVIVFPNVIVYEQGDYPLRLLKSSLLFLLPFTMYGAYILYTSIMGYVKNKKQLITVSIVILISIFLTFSFYFSYPQKNPKARFPGFNVSASDIHAVEYIHDLHADYDYIVLSNQLVSAAALTEYSFAKHFNSPLGELFYYSVPTGGPLYTYYGKMIYEGQKREYMIDAINLAGVDTAYFVVNKYWANSANIIEGAKLSADTSKEIDNGNVWVFEYKK